MTSPPYRSPATSPPLAPHMPLPNPKKRPSLNMPGGPQKRQKRTSIVSASSAHPLRQTSFPPEESKYDARPRSPSIDSDFTAVTGGKSVVTTGTVKRGRRKKKGRKVEGSVKSSGREKTVDGTARGGSEIPEDDEDDDEGMDGMEGMVENGDDTQAEKKKLDVLTGALDEEQYARYEVMRRVKFRKDTIRKITNQTVSQSVPPPVVITINGYTKTFVGLLIERAREVQKQWDRLETPPPTPRKVPIDPTDFHIANPDNEIFSTESTSSVLDDLTKAAQGSGEPVEQPAQPRYHGPLLPDHFREALRRYKRDGDGGGVGLSGASVGLGVPGSAVGRLGSRRLFK